MDTASIAFIAASTLLVGGTAWTVLREVTSGIGDNTQPNPRLETRATDTDVAKLPPNVGGEGHPPYQGPNYITEEDMADYMKPVPMWFGNIRRDDLAVDYQPGHVALDGGIWVAPDKRLASGIVSIPLSERRKAIRFGWEFHSDDDTLGWIKMWRPKP